MALMVVAVVLAQAGELDGLLRRLKADAAEARSGAAMTLEAWIRRPPEGGAFSDTPVDRPAAPPKLAPEAYDRAVLALAVAANDPDAKVREAAAKALAGVHGDRPSVKAALVRALESKDPTVAWYVHQAFPHVRPAFEAVWPALRGLLDIPNDDARSAVLSALSLYGPAARAAVPDLLRQVADPHEVVVYTLADIGVDEAQAREVAKLPPTFGVFLVLLPHPDVAADYLEKSPKILEDALLRPDPLMRVVEGVDGRLRTSLLRRPDLPDLFRGWSGDPRFRADLAERAAKAVGHRKPFLAACARACGARTDTRVKIGEFKPTSAHPGIDKSRMGEEGGHGDGFTPLLVTGRLRMVDGAPAVAPRFVNENDRMLMGLRQEEPGPLRYDPATGRFVFYTTVFAAYAMGKAGERGPYQTGSAQVRIEARGAKPLVVRFYDEMPDVEITLAGN